MESNNISKVGEAAKIGGLPGIVVGLALVALLVLPVPFRQEANSLRQDLDLYADPAGDQVAEVQYLLARQNSLLRGFVISRDTAFLAEYRDHVRRERQLHPLLAANAARLTPELVADIAELQTLSNQWHDRVDPGLGGLADQPTALSDLEPELHLASIEAASEAMQSVRRVVRERQAAIQTVERRMQMLYVLLFLVAAAALFAVAVLNARVRRLARESDARRYQIERAMHETERAVAARADLIRGFTHDVKNPLGVADGFAELLEMGLRGELTEDQRQTILRIRSAIRGAIEITNELLDLSRLESGGLQVERRRVDLAEIVGELVEDHGRAAEAVGHQLVWDRLPNGPKTIVAYTDPDRVRQIVQNLLSNAIKYTPAPGDIRVRLEVMSRSREREGLWATIAVADTGPGIPAEEQERIFDEFHRVPGSRGGGHGLGLAISRRIARMLGGEVTVESVLGQGSRFLLWVPLREEDSAAERLPAAEAARQGETRSPAKVEDR